MLKKTTSSHGPPALDGFVYTFPEHRGHRCAEMLLKEIERLARAEGVSEVYISTNHVGLYEKYGCVLRDLARAMDGEPSRIYALPVR